MLKEKQNETNTGSYLFVFTSGGVSFVFGTALTHAIQASFLGAIWVSQHTALRSLVGGLVCFFAYTGFASYAEQVSTVYPKIAAAGFVMSLAVLILLLTI